MYQSYNPTEEPDLLSYSIPRYCFILLYYYIAVVVGNRLEHRSLSTTRKGTVFGFRFFKFSRLHEKLVLIMDDFVMQDVSTYVIKRWSIPPQPGELMVDNGPRHLQGQSGARRKRHPG